MSSKRSLALKPELRTARERSSTSTGFPEKRLRPQHATSEYPGIAGNNTGRTRPRSPGHGHSTARLRSLKEMAHQQGGSALRRCPRTALIERYRHGTRTQRYEQASVEERRFEDGTGADDPRGMGWAVRTSRPMAVGGANGTSATLSTVQICPLPRRVFRMVTSTGVVPRPAQLSMPPDLCKPGIVYGHRPHRRWRLSSRTAWPG